MRCQRFSYDISIERATIHSTVLQIVLIFEKFRSFQMRFYKKMAIKWTPWDVPMHRRLEVFSATFAIFVALALGPLSCIIILYLLVSRAIIHQSKNIIRR